MNLSKGNASTALRALCLSSIAGLFAALCGASTGGTHPNESLVEKVRAATERYTDIDVAIAEGWAPATPCVSGPDTGAMGVHFVLQSRITGGVLNAEEPEALIYEPMANGAMRLVGVEYILIASAWAEKHKDGKPPALEGNLMNLVQSPNRYGLPSFFELHIWAWEHNPKGTFADWNTMVTCEHQRAD